MSASPSRALGQIALGLAIFAAFFLALDQMRRRAEPPTAPEQAAPEQSVPDQAAAPAPEAAAAPSVDVVRVAPDGAAVVAGRAEPGATVTLHAGDEALAEAKADANGDFVAIFQVEPSAEPRALTVQSETAEGARAISDQVVVLLPEPPGLSPDLQPAEPEAASPSTATPEAAATDTAAPESSEPTPPVTAAVVSPEGVSLTPLARPTGAAADRVSLASISYAAAGDITLDGFGRAGSKLRAYVDDAFAREGAVGADGRWRLALGDVAAGVYRLRIDQIGTDGAVESRLVTPFQRDYPQPRPTAEGGAAAPVSVVVQPGNNLWTLARLHYGSGVLYTQIFTANADLIGDPNLIYPGQIFRLPGKPTE